MLFRSKNVKNEKLLKFPTKLFLGSLKHAEYNKISEKNPSPKFRPVGEIIDIAKKGEFIPAIWNLVQTNDMIPLNDFKQTKQLRFNLALFCLYPVNLDVKNIHIKVWGVM